MDLQFLRADGTPAAEAIVSVAEAPVSMPDLAMVANAEGSIGFRPPVPGRFVLSVWVDGRAHLVPCELTPRSTRLTLRLGS